MNPWVLFDVSYLSHRARYGLKGLLFNDLPTGVIYGVFGEILHICSDPRIQSNKVGLFFDSKKSHRKKFFPDYKEKRLKNKTQEELKELEIMRNQVKRLRLGILPDIGFPMFKQSGLESDDLIAQACLQLDKGMNLAAIIISSDSDLYQCITQHTVHWFDPGRNSYLNHMDLWAKKQVEPNQWAEVKAIGGCSTDEVPGPEGVGEKTAIDYLTNNLKKTHKRYQAIVCPAGQRIIERNRKLVTLPHTKTRTLDLVEPKYNPDAFFGWCKKLGLKSFLDGPRRREWENFFKGEFKNTIVNRQAEKAQSAGGLFRDSK